MVTAVNRARVVLAFIGAVAVAAPLASAMTARALAAQDRAALSTLLSISRAPAIKPALVSTTLDDGVVIDDVAWKAMDGSEVQAYLVRPERAPADCCAGVMFVHWFAPPDPTSNRTQFLDEAKALARRGVISLLPSTFWSDAGRYQRRTWQTDMDNSVAQARELRRAFVMLGQQPHVERSRMAIVGHDYGAMFGALVAAVEPDAKAAVLIAGVPTFSSWYEFGSSTGVPKGDDLVSYRASLARIDPGFAVSQFSGALLFQFGTKDRYTPKEQYEAFVSAAAGAKEVKTYDSGHEMTAPDIRADRTRWLAAKLRIK
jgi:dienelactone hydrolase